MVGVLTGEVPLYMYIVPVVSRLEITVHMCLLRHMYMSWDVPGYHMHLYIHVHVRNVYIIFCKVFVVSPPFSPSKWGGASPCIQLHPLY